MPGNAGLMAASADCNLLFLQPKVGFTMHMLCTTVASCIPCAMLLHNELLLHEANAVA